MGFKTSIIYKAAEIAQAQNKHILDVVIQLQENEPTPQPPKTITQQRSFQEFSSTDESTNQQNQKQQDYDVLTIDVRLRSEGTPVGLLNYGNTCYFNSLIQTYFFIPKFMETIMNYRIPTQINMTTLSQERQKRISASINLVSHLQRLFGYLILSDKKYADPKQVLENIVDDQGNRIILGDQKDIGEFNLQFLERVQEGLNYVQGKAYDFSNQNGSANKQQSICVDLLDSQSEQKKGSLKKKIAFLPSEDEESVISQLFFGKKKEFITYYQEGTFKQFYEENVFLPIILDLQYQDLYTSWEHHNTFYIEDFKDNTGKITEAEKAGWITKSPEVLMFQIQRVVYLKEKGIAEKLNTPFHFEKEIYIDRFLLENRAYILRNKPKLKALKKKRDDIKKEIQSLKNYQNSNFSILNIMQMQLDFLKIKEQEFEEPVMEEDKFSPKTQQLLNNDNYLEISDFTLDQNTQASNISRITNGNSFINNSSPIDLLSLFSSPTPQMPLTPSSQSQLQSTIFDRNDHLNQNNSQSNSIQSIPTINNTSPPKNNQEPNSTSIKETNLIEPQAIQPVSQDPRIADINQKICALNNSKTNIQNQFLKVLEGLKMQTQELIATLENELVRINKEIDDIYENLKHNKYVLHAILVHQGYADSGHYFSYIYSQDQNKWFKFNDIQVQEEQESVVMKQAVGDGRSSAYCLVYVKEDIIKQRKYKHNFELMGDNECAQKITEITTSQGVKKKQVVIDLLNLEPDPPANQQIQAKDQKSDMQHVKSLVQEHIKAEILSQNRQQQVEMQQFKQLQLADMIVDNYSKRFSFINEYIRKMYEKSKKISSCPPLTNFGVYLRWLNENVTDILKIQLFDCAIREVSNQTLMLQDVANNQILQNRLINNFETMGEFKSPVKIVLSPREYEYMNKEYNKYLCKIACSHAILEAFNLILNKNIIASFDYFHYIQQYNTNQNDYFYRMSRDMFKVLLLKSSCSLFEQVDESNEVILKQIKFILLYSAKLQDNDTTSAQIYKILCDYMKYIGNNKLAQSREKLQSVISYLQQYDKLQEQFKSYLFQQEKRFEELDTRLMQQAMTQDKYFWKLEDVNTNTEMQINQIFSQINVFLREHINFHQNLVKYKKVLDIQERIQYNFQVNVKM
ncbi:hypothetical protein ABPG73_015873 [Tetrahymena malaccensis]